MINCLFERSLNIRCKIRAWLHRNDLVTSPFYDPKSVPNFVFAGDSMTNQLYSMEDVTNKLKYYGARITTEVKVDTDFLVALEGYETTTEYTKAQELGVTILRESDLIDYIGY